MADAQRVHVPGQNCILAGLPKDEYDRLAPGLEKVAPAFQETVIDADAPITHVYFPLNGVFSFVIHLEDGGTVEVCTVGNEGLVGTAVLLGADRVPMRAFMQIPGEALRMRADVFGDEVRRGGGLNQRAQRYTQAMVTQISQSAACNHLHSVEERTCRWLLMTHDRVGADEFPLTQEFLAQMLGVRRASVTVTAGILQRAGLIRYQRGRITVLDREQLEEASCECYGIVRRELERLMA